MRPLLQYLKLELLLPLWNLWKEMQFRWTMDFTKESPIKLKDNEQAHLLIEVDGNDTEVLFKECEVIASVVEALNCGEIMFAETEAQKDALWFLRRRVGRSCKSYFYIQRRRYSSAEI